VNVIVVVQAVLLWSLLTTVATKILSIRFILKKGQFWHTCSGQSLSPWNAGQFQVVKRGRIIRI
jgi:hypothetical protein